MRLAAVECKSAAEVRVWLELLRVKKNLNQEEVAQRLDVTPEALSQAKRPGKGIGPETLKKLHRLVKAHLPGNDEAVVIASEMRRLLISSVHSIVCSGRPPATSDYIDREAQLSLEEAIRLGWHTGADTRKIIAKFSHHVTDGHDGESLTRLCGTVETYGPSAILMFLCLEKDHDTRRTVIQS